jgi:hypothetical protein
MHCTDSPEGNKILCTLSGTPMHSHGSTQNPLNKYVVPILYFIPCLIYLKHKDSVVYRQTAIGEKMLHVFYALYVLTELSD